MYVCVYLSTYLLAECIYAWLRCDADATTVAGIGTLRQPTDALWCLVEHDTNGHLNRARDVGVCLGYTGRHPLRSATLYSESGTMYVADSIVVSIVSLNILK